jgi:hypothetical protein
MGAALFIRFERDFGNETGVTMSGKAIAAHLGDLDVMANRIKLVPLSDFVASQAEMLAELGVEADIDADIDTEEHWFEAETGIKTVNGLLRQGKATPNVGFDAALIADLEDLRAALKAAKQHNVRFYLNVDI